MGRLRILIVIAGAAAALALPVSRAVAATSVITVSHNQLLRNGLPWVPRGVQIVGLVAPDGALSGKYVAAHQQYGYAELQAAVADHADVVRFQVSQFGLDPAGPLYSPAYVAEVEGAVQTARSLGLAVIVSLQAQPPAGEPTRCPSPTPGPRAPGALAPMFAADGDVMFELYNEPGVAATRRAGSSGGPAARSSTPAAPARRSACRRSSPRSAPRPRTTSSSSPA